MTTVSGPIECSTSITCQAQGAHQPGSARKPSLLPLTLSHTAMHSGTHTPTHSGRVWLKGGKRGDNRG